MARYEVTYEVTIRRTYTMTVSARADSEADVEYDVESRLEQLALKGGNIKFPGIVDDEEIEYDIQSVDEL